VLDYGLMETLKGAIQSVPELYETLTGIYSYVPAEAQPPYMRVHVSHELKLDKHIMYGDVALTIVSRYRGQIEIYKLVKSLQQLLSQPLLTPDGHSLILKAEGVQSETAADHLTQTSTLVYRVKLKERN
jgi:hypothetical protein